MKLKSVLIALLVAVFTIGLSQSSFAQGTRYNYSHSISANPIALLFGIFNATYEHQTAPINSFTIFGSYWSLPLTDWAAYGLGASYRWYPKVFDDGKRPLEGFSAGPRAEANFWKYANSLYDGGTTFALGGEASYKWVWGGFVLEPTATLMFTVNKNSVVGLSGETISPFSIGANIGYAW